MNETQNKLNFNFDPHGPRIEIDLMVTFKIKDILGLVIAITHFICFIECILTAISIICCVSKQTDVILLRI